jgi:hypothetical protein
MFSWNWFNIKGEDDFFSLGKTCPLFSCATRERTTMISKIDYVKKLAAIYYAANLSDSDSEDRPAWMHGDECHIHCQAIDYIVRDMGLSEIWCNIIEGDCLDQLDEVQFTGYDEPKLTHEEFHVLCDMEMLPEGE